MMMMMMMMMAMMMMMMMEMMMRMMIRQGGSRQSNSNESSLKRGNSRCEKGRGEDKNAKVEQAKLREYLFRLAGWKEVRRPAMRCPVLGAVNPPIFRDKLIRIRTSGRNVKVKPGASLKT